MVYELRLLPMGYASSSLLSLLNSTPSTLEYVLFSGETVMFASLRQDTGAFEYLKKASTSNCSTPLPIVTDSRFVHSENVAYPITFTLSGIVISFKLEQPEKEAFSIIITLSGIVISFKLEQPSKDAPSECRYDPIVINPLGRFTCLRSEQFVKAKSPITVTPSGTDILSRALQLQNIPTAISFKPFGRIIFESDVQPEKA